MKLQGPLKMRITRGCSENIKLCKDEHLHDSAMKPGAYNDVHNRESSVRPTPLTTGSAVSMDVSRGSAWIPPMFHLPQGPPSNDLFMEAS